MSINLFVNLLASLVMFALMVVPVFFVSKGFKWATRKRKSPLSGDLLRSPGQSLAEQIEDITSDVFSLLLAIPLIALTMIASFLLQMVLLPGVNLLLNAVVTIIMVMGATSYFLVTAYRQFHHRNKLRLGYECEVATGQGLNKLLRHGFNVYHDFPADGFNIDHIAIGPTGVYAIEAKGRSKPLDAEGPNHKLTFDSVSLQFPGWSENKPLDQAKRQAKWLSIWLGSATGSPVAVRPVLSLPGWFITQTKPSDIMVSNGKRWEFLAKGKHVLSPERIKAISHQVEGKCRDVKAVSYKKDQEK